MCNFYNLEAIYKWSSEVEWMKFIMVYLYNGMQKRMEDDLHIQPRGSIAQA